MKDLNKVLKDEKIQNVRLRMALTLSSKTPLKKVFSEMKEKKRGSVLVVDKAKLVGIFTERDVLTKVVEKKLSLDTTLNDVMTTSPKTLKIDDSVASAIKIMNKGGYRHLPLVDKDGRLHGVVGVKDILSYLAEHFPHEVYNLPPNPDQVIRVAEGA